MKRSTLKRYTPSKTYAQALARKVARDEQRKARGQQRPKGLGRGKGLTAKPDRQLMAWSKKVRERDDYTCQRCGIRDEFRCIAHHRAPRSTRPDLRLLIANGVTLCPECHSEVHANPITSRAAGWLASESYEKARKAA